MPFITEELWFQLYEFGKPRGSPYRSLALENYAVVNRDVEDRVAEERMSLLQELIVAARNIRAELRIDAKCKVRAECLVQSPEARSLMQANLEPVLRLATLSDIHFATTSLDPTRGVMKSTALFDLLIPYGEGIDRQAEIRRLRREIEKLAQDIQAKEDRLADPDFTRKAPEHVVNNLRATKVERQVEQKKLNAQLQQLEGSQAAGT
jgi:valyl-tRNA synthetase